MGQIDRAASCFEQGFSCTQALLSTYGAEFGLNRETALKVAGAFGGGMAQTAETCGSVTGALMVIGLKYGMTRVEDKQSKFNTYGLAKDFMDKFKSLNGSIVCRELLGYDISTPDGLQAAREKGLFTTLCPKFVKDAAGIVEDILV